MCQKRDIRTVKQCDGIITREASPHSKYLQHLGVPLQDTTTVCAKIKKKIIYILQLILSDSSLKCIAHVMHMRIMHCYQFNCHQISFVFLPFETKGFSKLYACLVPDLNHTDFCRFASLFGGFQWKQDDRFRTSLTNCFNQSLFEILGHP